MIVAVLVLMVITVLGVVGVVTLLGRIAYRQSHAERADLERHKRWAERRLHDVSSRAFESMLNTAREASRPDQVWRP